MIQTEPTNRVVVVLVGVILKRMVLKMTDKKPTDSEIVKAKEISLKEQIEHYNKRRKAVFDSYYRRNTDGAEDTLEICVLRESAVLISKLESIINRLQAENEALRTCVEQIPLIRKDGKSPLSLLTADIKAEAYKECIDKVKMEAENATCVYEPDRPQADNMVYHISSIRLDNLLKELVGEDNG
jgi:hypothetical protein